MNFECGIGVKRFAWGFMFGELKKQLILTDVSLPYLKIAMNKTYGVSKSRLDRRPGALVIVLVSFSTEVTQSILNRNG